jgi:hypothetical protein
MKQPAARTSNTTSNNMEPVTSTTAVRTGAMTQLEQRQQHSNTEHNNRNNNLERQQNNTNRTAAQQQNSLTKAT